MGEIRGEKMKKDDEFTKRLQDMLKETEDAYKTGYDLVENRGLSREDAWKGDRIQYAAECLYEACDALAIATN